MVYKSLASLGYTLFPPTCVLCGGCGSGRLDLCRGCRDDLPELSAGCRRCGAPLPARPPAEKRLCGACLRKPPWFDHVHCPLRYDSPVDWLIHRLKFNARLSHVRVLGALLADSVEQRSAAPPGLLVPVPLHPRRRRERGFNQALELARPVARRLGVPLAADLCERRHNTPHQFSLPAGRRRANVRNAFVLRRPPPAKHVALIDDVVTTGATVNELARLLKRGGAERVEVWAVARTVFD